MKNVIIKEENEIKKKKLILKLLLENSFITKLLYIFLSIFIIVIFFHLHNINKEIAFYKEKSLAYSKQVKERENDMKKIKNYEEEIEKYKSRINSLENKILIKTKNCKNELTQNLENNNQTLNNKPENEFKESLINEINKIYKKNGVVNINKIESNIKGGRQWNINKNKTYEINIGFTMDPGFVLQTMLTLASIMDSQKASTKIKFHFGVVNGFNAENMLKVYSLRKKIRDDVEFIFYNAQKVENELKGLNPKGAGPAAKLLLPHLLSDDIDKLILFDAGDLLVLRDLTEMYNWDIGDNLYLGTPDPGVGKFAKISNRKCDVYINTGHFVLNIKKIKSENMYDKFLKYKDVYNNKFADQDLLNDIAQDKIGYIPVKFGIFASHSKDERYDSLQNGNEFEFYQMNEKNFKNKFSFIPNNSDEFYKQSCNPVVIHQWNGKWSMGDGLSIYRRLAQYYIRYAGIWDELCSLSPGYCIK